MVQPKFMICFFTVITLFVLILNSCNLAYVSQEQRLNQFLNDLNNDSTRTEIYKNLHPTIVSGAWNSSATWEGYFSIGVAPYSFSNVSYNGSVVSGQWSCKDFTDDSFECHMAEYGTEGWRITFFSHNGLEIIPNPAF